MKIGLAFTFEASHRRPGGGGMRRHSYRVELTLTGPVDPRTGCVIDFFEVKAVAEPLLGQLDQHCLNDVEGLENPTAEIIAIWIWRRAKPPLPLLSSVRVYETPRSWAEYEG